MKRHLRPRLLAPLAALALGLGLAGCVAYPDPYAYYGGGGYYGGGYYGGGYYAPPAYTYAPPVVGFNFGWWGGGHDHDDWRWHRHYWH
jgi:hypothetical protein